MAELTKLLALCEDICAAPRAGLDKCLASGRKAVGIMPYFCPEELVYAAGMLPFGLWGARVQANESKRYFPSFICSILHTTLELGLTGALDGLSAIMVPNCCDSLKSMGTNWEYGVKSIPVINVAYAQNRKMAAGVEFTASQIRKIRGQLEEIAGHAISDADIAAAVEVYNTNRAAILAFSDAAAEHPELVSPAQRCAAIKAGYFMDRAKHSAILADITALLKDAPASEWKGLRVVTTGIMADYPELLDIFGRLGIAIVADQTEQESVPCCPAPADSDPIMAMARRLADTEGSCILFDPGKVRGQRLVEKVKETGADAVIWVMTQFCDPEEFDYVPVRRMLDAAGIPHLAIELDQQMQSFTRAESSLEAFVDIAK